MSRIRIATLEEIEEGKTIKFSFTRGERLLEGFVGRFKGKLFAYENTCRHIPISLDYGDNRFFTNQGDALMCQTHGAVYEPDTLPIGSQLLLHARAMCGGEFDFRLRR